MKKIIDFFTRFLDSIENISLKQIREWLRKFKFGNLIFAIFILISIYFTIINLRDWGCEKLQKLCEETNSEEWYCVCNNPTISEQLANLKNSQQAAPWKVTLDHIQTNNKVKIIPKIELADKAYFSLFKINESSDVIIIKANNYSINNNDKFDLAWNVDLAAGKNIFKVIITPHAIDWETILSNKDVELIESLQKRVNFWTSDSLTIYGK